MAMETNRCKLARINVSCPEMQKGAAPVQGRPYGQTNEKNYWIPYAMEKTSFFPAVTAGVPPTFA